MSKVIIFDFDGVLADSVNTVFKMNKEAVSQINKTLTMDEYLSCFGGHINQRLAILLNLNEEEKRRLIEIKADLFPSYYRTQEVKLFSFSKELVVKARDLGELWIVSSSPRELIINILESYGLVDYFTKIIGQNSQPKNLFFQSTLKDKKGGEVFFITDTTGDIKEARMVNSNILTIAVTWGFHSEKVLKVENPDLLASEYNEILDFIKTH
ncbi:MAG: HAD hydrolase-like protein [Candidatus Paceibacterota bacterium]|jgi:phosphoglycolate phosphatase